MILPLIALSLLPAPAAPAHPPVGNHAMPGHDDTVVILACLVYEASLMEERPAAPAQR